MKHFIWTMIGLLFMAAIGVVGTYIIGSHDKKVSNSFEKNPSSLSSFVSSIIDRINGK